tara:strand:- start:127 stop:1209 length:1083 start_codon:yes stop_codon:yes gene_type:complete
LVNKHISQLDVFRGLAALSVCAVHFTYDSFFHKYFAQGLFVQLFFTLSGFVIAYNYYNTLINFKDLSIFMLKRFKRLYPLHLFFLILFLLIELVKYILISNFDISSNNQPFETNTVKNFFLNLFFIQHFDNQNSFNGPSWSISVEMMLYLSFGLILLLLIKKNLFLSLNFIYLIFFIIFLNATYGDTKSITAYYSGMYSFCIGYLFYILYEKRKISSFLKSKNYFDILFYFFLSIFLLEIFYFHFLKQDYLYSIAFGLMIYYSCFLDNNFFLFKFVFNRFFVFLGKISYSIYMSHLFVFFMFDNLLEHVFKFQTKVDLNGNMVLDISKFEANFFTIIIYVTVLLFSNFTYKNIELKYYKK